MPSSAPRSSPATHLPIPARPYECCKPSAPHVLAPPARLRPAKAVNIHCGHHSQHKSIAISTTDPTSAVHLQYGYSVKQEYGCSMRQELRRRTQSVSLHLSSASPLKRTARYLGPSQLGVTARAPSPLPYTLTPSPFPSLAARRHRSSALPPTVRTYSQRHSPALHPAARPTQTTSSCPVPPRPLPAGSRPAGGR